MAKISIASMIRAQRGYLTLLKSREREKIPLSVLEPLISPVTPVGLPALVEDGLMSGKIELKA